MDLFESQFSQEAESHQWGPLADRMRPKTMDQFVGQQKALGSRSALLKNIDQGFLPNLILWGPPGTGKTTFALILSQKLKAHFINLNAVDTGAKELREVGQAARDRKLQFQERTLVFIDEIHRLNRAQQDVLLPFMEKGDFTVIGATTENPSYALNGALLSRSQVLVFEHLEASDLTRLLERAFVTEKIPLQQALNEEARQALVAWSRGDARRLLSATEMVTQAFRLKGDSAFEWPLQTNALFEILKSNPLPYDKVGEAHYDTISAFIKSIRGSDADAGLYYMARMLEAGEDPVFIARRLVILASEDVGNADPRGLSVAVAGLQAVELVGMPEAAINLAQVVTYLASAPKSNRSYEALHKAQAAVQRTGPLPIPLHLRSSKTSLSKSLGYGKGYRYSHDYDRGFSNQDYLPDAIKDEIFYEPSDRGFEKNIREYQTWVKGQRREPNQD